MAGIVVAVLGGGPSPEREISLATAAAVARSLSGEGFSAVPVTIGTNLSWSLPGAGPLAPEAAVAALRERGVRVVFPGLHGPFGEDGTIQGFLEVCGFACVGSGVGASALSMDKPRAREAAAARGLAVAAGLEFADVSPEEATERVLGRLGLPVVVKDPVGGSSLGMEMPRSPEDLRTALASFLSRPGGRVLVEERLTGLELSVPVLGNASTGGPVETLPPILIRPLRSDWFDYRTKYDPEAVEELCPAPVPADLAARVSGDARTVHRTFRCDGLTRTDFIVPEDGAPRFLELNTLPGLTAASLCPKAAAAAGIPFPELLRRLVRLALEKRPAGGEA